MRKKAREEKLKFQSFIEDWQGKYLSIYLIGIESQNLVISQCI
jgi:hypothetical protein